MGLKLAQQDFADKNEEIMFMYANPDCGELIET